MTQGNKRRRRRRLTPEERFRQEVLLPLLAMFAVVDDVMSEDGIFESEATMRMSLGRIYREWKQCRHKLDPEFDPAAQERPERWLPKQVGKARSSTRRRATD